MTHTASHIILTAMETQLPKTPIKVRDLIGAIVGGGLVFLFV